MNKNGHWSAQAFSLGFILLKSPHCLRHREIERKAFKINCNILCNNCSCLTSELFVVEEFSNN